MLKRTLFGSVILALLVCCCASLSMAEGSVDSVTIHAAMPVDEDLQTDDGEITLELPSVTAVGSRPNTVPERVFRFDQVLVLDRGYLTVSWEDSLDSGPYKLEYYNDLLPDVWFYAADGQSSSAISEKKIVIKSMTPGSVYHLRLTDRDGKSVETKLVMPDPEPFSNGDVTADKITTVCEFRYQKAGSSDPRQVNYLSASRMNEKLDSTQYGFFYEICFEPINTPLDCHVQIRMTAPNGFAYITHDDHMTMPVFRKGTGRYTYRFIGSGLFSELKRRCGSVLPGEYTIDLYLDGKYVRSDRFTIKE